MKITKVTSKEKMIKFLEDAYMQGIKDKALRDSILYAQKQYNKDPESVTKVELFALVEQVERLGFTSNTASTTTTAKPVEALAKKKGVITAEMFPPEIQAGDLKLVAVPEKYTSIDDIRKAIEDGVTLVCANYWNKQQIKKFNYKRTYDLKKSNVTSFEDNLDLIEIIYVLSKEDKIIGISSETDAICIYYGEDLEPDIETDEDGNEVSTRYSNNMEFEIYEVVENEEDETVEEEEEAPKRTTRRKAK